MLRTCFVVWLWLGSLGLSAGLAQEPKKRDPFQAQVLPIIERYCVDCHSIDDAEAGIVLDRSEDQASAVDDGRTWLRVRDALEGHVMPPRDKPQPSARERETLLGWLENDFLAAQRGKQAGSAPVVIRRLNRQEYNNTIRDLLGVDLRLADAFPPDDIGFGFDNVGSALNISPILVEKYLDAAEVALDRAIVLPDASGYPPIELIGLKTYPLPPDKAVEFPHSLKPGRYLADFSLVRVGIAESVAPPRLLVGFGKDRRTVEAVRVQDETVVYRYWLDVAEGDDTVHVSLDKNQGKRGNATRAVGANVSGDQRYEGDRGLHVDSMVVHGPVLLPVPLPESHRKILFVTPGLGDASRLDRGSRVIARFAETAFRRPVPPEELERIVGIFRMAHDRGESFERCIQVALTTVLASPRFLFLVEPEGGGDRPLTEFELAARISYFLWSSMPDEELAREARAGTLRANLRPQVARMLDDPRSSQLVENFAGQWLQLRRLLGVTPDKDLFPGFDEPLREAMRRETELYLGSILRENRSILELLDSDYTYVNETLARHYGIEGVRGAEFRRVALTDRRRGGILTQASVLTLTSNPNRTSPVKRGQWILQQILGTPPAPPPPDVAKLDESPKAAENASLRERMEAHRANPQCASCHQQMDAMGFALENFDAVGRWRANDGAFPIDPAGELAGGRPFSDIGELKRLLRSAEDKKFARTLIANLLTYGLGRGLEVYDSWTVEEIRGTLAADGYRVRNILFGIVESRAFQYRGVSP
jgi:Protein of unknown function (DUF1592)/Protein of unknown function (DUF1588)/Protein of unknown function (DUF1587)/Protein of unknown function (DUF1585)/Protein of unknown function (DUF1595)/Planctomycete cytochrome C